LIHGDYSAVVRLQEGTMPHMEYVDSSSIEAVGYNLLTRELYIRFRDSGDTYVYYDVDEWVYVELMQSESKGVYVNAQIKPNYDTAKL
jgi:hypothetical protein